jgi:predicted RecB family nuclease
MAAKPQTEAPTAKLQESFTQARTASIDTVSALAHANERIVGKLIELSSAAALETVRTYAELQAAFVDAVRTAPMPEMPTRETITELGRNPLGWVDQRVAGAAHATERIARLAETNARIVAGGVERFSAEAEKATREIRDAVTSCVDAVRAIQPWNGSTPAPSAN